MNLIDPIIGFQAELQPIRRDLHAHPEPSYEEQRTSDVVANKLTEWQIPILRANTDALPMQELNTFFAYASQHQGKMHACGHDGHTAMLLGATHHLARHRNFDGTVYLIFQPVEESCRSAQRMVDDGLLDKCPMEAVFGMHTLPGAAIGSFSVRPGPMMASSNEFEVIIKGKGSHAAQLHKSIDPVMVTVQIAHSWQDYCIGQYQSAQPDSAVGDADP